MSIFGSAIDLLLPGLRITRQGVGVDLHRRRPGFLTLQHVLGSRVIAISRFHVAIVERDDRAFEFESGEQAFAARIRQYLGVEPQIGRSPGLTPYWTSRDRSVSAQLEFALEQTAHPVVADEEQDEVSGLPADLKSDAPAFQIEVGRITPPVFIPATGHPASAAPSDDEAGFEYLRKDGDALSFVQHAHGNRLVRRGHDLLKNL